MKLQSEQNFLDIIDSHFPTLSDTVRLGRGDDGCVIDAGPGLTLSTDLFLEDVHFRRSYFAPSQIGHKALAVNLSDMAAMGAKPLGFLMNLMVPPDMDEKFLQGMLAGMAALAEKHEVELAGGDLSRSERLGLAITVWGKAGPTGRFLTRSGFGPGDLLFCVGPLGLARTGLLALEERGPSACKTRPAACKAHLEPRPLVAEGLLLAGLEDVLGLMDVSDGLAMDLPRFLASAGLGADLRLDPSSLHPEVLDAAGSAEAAVETAVRGGEDYALLGAARPRALRLLQATVPGLAVMGSAVPRPGIRVNGRNFSGKGFDHFNR